MGAGDGRGPDHHRQAEQAADEERGKRELRHEHADDEQRIRYRDVGDDRLSGTHSAFDRKSGLRAASLLVDRIRRVAQEPA